MNKRAIQHYDYANIPAIREIKVDKIYIRFFFDKPIPEDIWLQLISKKRTTHFNKRVYRYPKWSPFFLRPTHEEGHNQFKIQAGVYEFKIPFRGNRTLPRERSRRRKTKYYDGMYDTNIYDSNYYKFRLVRFVRGEKFFSGHTNDTIVKVCRRRIYNPLEWGKDREIVTATLF